MRFYYITRFSLLGLTAGILILACIGLSLAGILAFLNYVDDLNLESVFFGILTIFAMLSMAFPFVGIHVFEPWYENIKEHEFRKKTFHSTPLDELYVRFEEKENVDNKDDYYLATDGDINF